MANKIEKRRKSTHVLPVPGKPVLLDLGTHRCYVAEFCAISDKDGDIDEA